MAVALDATSESHSGTSGSASETSFSWTHTPVGTPKGILVFVHGIGGTFLNPTVTWGGLSIPAVTGGDAIDTAGEQGRTFAFFLGSGLSSRADDVVVVSRDSNVAVGYATALTVTADGDTAVYEAGIVIVEEDATIAEQSVDDGSPGSNSLRVAGLYSGLQTGPSAGANSTLAQSIDLGGTWCGLAYETTPGQGSRSVGFSSGTSDDTAAVHLAITDLGAAPGGDPEGLLIGGKLLGRGLLGGFLVN